MWGIFIAKYDPNLLETIFGYGPFQLNEYLYGEKVFLDVPYYKLESLFLPHSSLLDVLIFFGSGGLVILVSYILFALYSASPKKIEPPPLTWKTVSIFFLSKNYSFQCF